jgi:hypothetical protein
MRSSTDGSRDRRTCRSSCWGDPDGETWGDPDGETYQRTWRRVYVANMRGKLCESPVGPWREPPRLIHMSLKY